jgi:hypothetical protein
MAKSLDQRPRPWFAHEQPERPLDRAVFVCGCVAYMLAVRAAAEMGGAALTAGRGLADLLPGDEVRDVGPASG